MALVPRNTLEHFNHPRHRLTKHEVETEYLCDGCKTIGRGTRFRCIEGCNFDLHDYCATCPLSLSTYMHPKHTLSLVQAARQLNRFCDMCLDPVEGLSYRCNGCDFDVHPLCTQLPEKLRHALHTGHHLQLRTSSSGSCAVCGGRCTSWRYGCVTCGFDIHIDCVVAPPSPPGGSAHRSVPPCSPSPLSSSTERGVSGFDPSGSHWPPQHNYHGYGYPFRVGVGFGVPYYFPIPYNNNTYNHTNYHAQGGAGANGGIGKKMFGILGQLTIGVVSNVLFGALGLDFSSFN